MTNMVILDWPLPPPLSALYRNVPRVGRVKTKRYTQWERTVGGEHMVKRLRAGNDVQLCIGGPVAVEYTIQKTGRRRRDLDNLAKALNDQLTKCGVIEDDSLIQRCSLQWDTTGTVKGVHVVVTRWELP